MSDPLRFPCRDREAPFDLFAFDAMTREKLAGDERRVVRQVGLDLALEHGSRIETFGDALDLLASAGPQGRRALVDRARTSLGMQTIEGEQLEVRQRAVNNALPMTDPQGRRLVECADPKCTRVPTNPNGSLRPVADRRWWCDEHRGQAGPEDHLPPAPRYVIAATGGVRAVGEELERLKAEDRKRREQWERDQEAKRKEGERLARLEEEHRATLKPPAWMRRT